MLNEKKDLSMSYQQDIDRIKKEGQELYQLRNIEINRLTIDRWTKFNDTPLAVNTIEGKIKVNERKYKWSEITGAEAKIITGIRTITTNNTVSHKHASLGGAVLGGMVAGPVGAAIGGSTLGKTTTTSQLNSNNIPICTHFGVNVYLKMNTEEIVLSNQQMDQGSKLFRQLQKKAQTIIDYLQQLSQSPMPDSYTSVEDEPSIKQIETQMIEKEDELKKATAALQKYRTALQQGMSDSDYLRYLSDLGDQRKSSSEIPKYRPKSGILTQSQHQEQMIYEHNNDVDVENIEKEASILKKIGNVIYAVI